MLVHQDRQAGSQRLILTPSAPFSLAATVLSHGWVNLAPWDWDGSRIARDERFGAVKGRLSVIQQNERELSVEWVGCPGVADGDIAQRVSRWFSLDWHSGQFQQIARVLSPRLSAFMDSGGGRFLRGSCFYEDFLKTICTINTTWAQTIRMVSALNEIGGGYFPTPTEVLAAGEPVLKERCRLGFRTETALRATERMLRENILDVDGNADEPALTYDYLLSLRGIGPYAAAHCRVLLLDFSRLPVDSEVSSYLVARGIEPKECSAHFYPWGSYAFLAYKLSRIVERSNWIGSQG